MNGPFNSSNDTELSAAKPQPRDGRTKTIDHRSAKNAKDTEVSKGGLKPAPCIQNSTPRPQCLRGQIPNPSLPQRRRVRRGSIKNLRKLR